MRPDAFRLKLLLEMNRFIDQRKDNWQRLEFLLEQLTGTSLNVLSRTEIRELGELYRRAAADLAIARAETRDPKVINYLNSLVIRAHGKIYRSNGDLRGLLKNFFLYEFPEAFRRTWRYTFTAFAVFFGFAIISFVLCYYSTDFVSALGLESVQGMVSSNSQWWLGLNDANQIGASRILTNNIQVAVLAFAFGVLFGLGTLYVLSYNGLFIGGVLGICYSMDPNFGNLLVDFMVAHGVVELTCIFIAGGAGMSIGYALIDPGDLSRSQALKLRGVQAAKLVLGCAVLLFFAGIIEGFISPSDLPPAVKYAVGILTGTALFAYLLTAGRTPPAVAE